MGVYLLSKFRWVFFRGGLFPRPDWIWLNPPCMVSNMTKIIYGKLRNPNEINQYYYMACMEPSMIIVPTPLVGGGTIYSNGFFFVPWILADRYIHRREMCVVSLKSSSIVEFEIKKIFLNFVFFEELSRFKVSCEHWIFGLLLFTFTVIFVRINVFSSKNLIQN